MLQNNNYLLPRTIFYVYVYVYVDDDRKKNTYTFFT